MKITFIKAIIFSLLILSGFLYLSNPSGPNKNRSGGALDNPSERVKWELKRLRDPVTGKIPDNIRNLELEFAAGLPKSEGSERGSIINWTFRGPWNVGGRTRALAYDVNNENILFSGSVSGGLWKSENGGQSWRRVTPVNFNQSVTCIAQDKRPAYDSIWYYGSGEGSGTSASGTSAFFLGSGIYKSIDKGNSWERIYPKTKETPQAFDSNLDIIWNIAVDQTDTGNGEVYAATYGGIYRSTDGGDTFAGSFTSGVNKSYYTDVAVTPKGVVYAFLSDDGQNKGIFRSDNGINWVKIMPANFPSKYDRMVIGVNPSDETDIYFLGQTPGYGKLTTNYQGDPEYNSLWNYKYLSGNGAGANGEWLDLSANLPQKNSLFGNFNSQGGYDLVVTVKPDDKNVVIIGGTNLYRSTSGFRDSLNTTQIGGYGIGSPMPYYTVYPNHHPDQHALVFSKQNPNVLYSGSDGGINRTDDILSPVVKWTSLNYGYLTSQFYTVAIDHGIPGSPVIAAGAQDNGTQFSKTLSSTVNWTQPSHGDGSYCAIADSGKYYYFSRQLGKMLKATMGPDGITTNHVRIDPKGGSGYDFINPFVLDPNNNNMMYLAGGYMIWRNNDLSAITMDSSWNEITTNWDSLINTRNKANKISALSISKKPATRLYYGTENKKLYRVDNAHAGNPAVSEITYSGFPLGGAISCIAIDEENADNIMVVFSNYSVVSLFFSRNGGGTWTRVAGNLEEKVNGTGNGPSCRWGKILHIGNDTAWFVGTSTGLYGTNQLSGDSTKWVLQAPANIGNMVVNMLEARESDDWIVAITHGNGIYTASFSNIEQVTGIKSPEKKISGSGQIKISPNPVKTNAILEFQSQENDFSEIKLLNQQGQLVNKPVSKNILKGHNRFTIDLSGIKPGVYFCVLETRNKRIIGKLVKVD